MQIERTLGVRRRPSWRGERRGQGGFTMIEMLVVVAILGILAAISMFSVTGVTQESNRTGCRVERQTLIAAMRAAEATNDPDDTYVNYIHSGIKYFKPSAVPGTAWEPAVGHPRGDCPETIPA